MRGLVQIGDQTVAVAAGVAAHGATGQRLRAGIVNAAAALTIAAGGHAVGCVAIADGEVGDGDGGVRSDLENAAVGVATDGEARCTRADNNQIGGDEQFAGGECDAARDREVDRVPGSSVLDGLAQRATSAIVGIADGDCGRAQLDRQFTHDSDEHEDVQRQS